MQDDNKKKFYSYLKDSGLTELPEKDFFNKYSDKNNASQIWEYMKSQGQTTLSLDDFHSKYLLSSTEAFGEVSAAPAASPTLQTKVETPKGKPTPVTPSVSSFGQANQVAQAQPQMSKPAVPAVNEVSQALADYDKAYRGYIDADKFIQDYKKSRPATFGVPYKYEEALEASKKTMQSSFDAASAQIDKLTDAASKNIGLDKLSKRDAYGQLIADDEKIDITAKAMLKKLGIAEDSPIVPVVRQKLRDKIDYEAIKPEVESALEKELGMSSEKWLKERLASKSKDVSKKVAEERLPIDTKFQAQHTAIYNETKQLIDSELKPIKQQIEAPLMELKSQTEAQLAQLESQINALNQQASSGAISKAQYNGDFSALKTQYDSVVKRFEDERKAATSKLLFEQNRIGSKYLTAYNSQLSVLNKQYASELNAKMKALESEFGLSKEDKAFLEKKYKDAYSKAVEKRNERKLTSEKSLPGQALTNALLAGTGSTIASFAGYFDADAVKLFGEGLQRYYQTGVKDIEWADLIDPIALQKNSAQLLTSMIPSVVAGTAVSAATRGLGAGIGAQMIAGGFASWTMETGMMAGALKNEVLKQTGDIVKANEAKNEMILAQIPMLLTNVIQMNKFMPKGIFNNLTNSAGKRIALGVGTELVSQTAEEVYQGGQEDRILEGGDYFDGLKKMGEFKRWKENFIVVAPTAGMAAYGAVKQEINTMKEAQEKSLEELATKAVNLKATIAQISPSQVPMALFDMMNIDKDLNITQEGLAKGVVSSLFASGAIDQSQADAMMQSIEDTKRFVEAAQSIGLNRDQVKIYASLSHRLNEMKAKAESAKDEASKKIFETRAAKLQDNLVAFAQEQKGDFAVVIPQQGDAMVLTLDELEVAVEQEEFQNQLRDKEAGVVLTTLNEQEKYKKLNEKIENITNSKKEAKEEAPPTSEQPVADVSGEQAADVSIPAEQEEATAKAPEGTGESLTTKQQQDEKTGKKTKAEEGLLGTEAKAQETQPSVAQEPAKEQVAEISEQEAPINEQTEIPEGTEVSLPPAVEGGMARNMVRIEGEWKQKVGGELQSVGKPLQDQAQSMYEESVVQAKIENIQNETVETQEKTKPETVKNAPEGTFINVGMVAGKTKEPVTIQQIQDALPDDVKVEEVTELKIGEAGVLEPTASIKLSRELTDEEMLNLRKATKQLAIPQMTDGQGVMYGTKDWGPFNAEYFAMPDKTKLSEKTKEAEPAQELTKEQLAEKTREERKNRFRKGGDGPKNFQASTGEELDEAIDAAKGKEKEKLTAVKKVIAVLGKIAPSIRITVHSGRDTYAQAVVAAGGKQEDASSNGFYDARTNEIHINVTGDINTIFHETAHPILEALADNNVPLIVELNAQLEKLALPGVSDVLEWTQENYSDPVQQKKEAIVEFMARVASGQISLEGLPKSTIEKIKEFIANVFEALGMDVPNNLMNTLPGIVNLAKDFTDAIQNGKELNIKAQKTGQQGVDFQYQKIGKYDPLPGAPKPEGATGPIKELVDVAEKYAKKFNIPYTRQGVYVQIDEQFSKRIADAYENMKHDPKNPKVKEAYANLIKQTKAQYKALQEAGYKFTFFDSNTDPYKGNPMEAMRDLRNNKQMAVYGTYDGYGTEGITGASIEDNPMLESAGMKWPDQNGVMRDVTANDLFRAVHDAFGHGLEGAGFRARGEENAWQAHARLFTGSAVAAITTETRGQNSWLNYGPFGEKNRTAKIEDTVFAEQKVGLMPEWTWTENVAPSMKDVEESNILFQKRAQPKKGDDLIKKAGKSKAVDAYKNMTSDGEGNYVFFHYTGPDFKGNKIDPKYFKKNAYTSDRRMHNISFYYAVPNFAESMVMSGNMKLVKVKDSEVYPLNTDPLNYYDEAERRFKKDFGDRAAFAPDMQASYIGQVAKENGFKMLVAAWETRGFKGVRGESQTALPVEKKSPSKYFKGGKEIKGPQFQKTAWHGSPHKFDKFTTKKIGAGEGAQAFGWGLYFTEVKDIAEWYATTLAEYKNKSRNSQRFDITKDIKDFKIENEYFLDGENLNAWIKKNKISNEILRSFYNNAEELSNTIDMMISHKELDIELTDINMADWISSIFTLGIPILYKKGLKVLLKRDVEKLLKIKEKVSNAKELTRENNIKSTLRGDIKNLLSKLAEPKYRRNLYKVMLNGDNFLEFNKPLSENQITLIKEQAKKESVDISNVDFEGDASSVYAQLGQHWSLKDVESSDKETSLFLLRAGIDGIKYPAEMLTREQPRGFNYVVFDENAVEIEERIAFQKQSEDAEVDRFLQDITDKNEQGIYTKDTLSEDLQELFGLSKDKADAIAKDYLSPKAKEVNPGKTRWEEMKENMEGGGEKDTLSSKQRKKAYLNRILNDPNTPVEEKRILQELESSYSQESMVANYEMATKAIDKYTADGMLDTLIEEVMDMNSNIRPAQRAFLASILERKLGQMGMHTQAAKLGAFIDEQARAGGQFNAMLGSLLYPEAVARAKKADLREKETAQLGKTNPMTGRTYEKDIEALTENLNEAAAEAGTKASKSKKTSKAISSAVSKSRPKPNQSQQGKEKISQLKKNFKSNITSFFNTPPAINLQAQAAQGNLTPDGIKALAEMAVEYANTGVKRVGDIATMIREFLEDEMGYTPTDAEVQQILHTSVNGSSSAQIIQGATSENVAKALKDDVIRRVNPASKTGNKSLEMFDIILKHLKGKLGDTIKTEKSSVDKLQQIYDDISEAYANRDEAKEAFAQAQQMVMEKLNEMEADGDISSSEKAEILNNLHDYFGDFVGLPFSASKVRTLVTRGLRDEAQVIKDLIREHYSKKQAVRENLVDKIVRETGLPAIYAQEVAQAVREEFEAKIKEAAENEYARIFGRSNLKTKTAKTTTERIIAAYNMGAFENDFARGLFSQKFGFVEVTPEMERKIAQFIDDMQRYPEGSLELHKKMTVMNAYIDTLKRGSSEWRYITSLLSEIFYTNILGTFGTIMRSLKGAAMVQAGEAFVEMFRNPVATARIIKNLNLMSNGASKGIDTVRGIMRDGYAPYSKNPQASRGVLDSLMDMDWKKPENAKEAMKLTAKVWTWLPVHAVRAVMATDAFFRMGAREYYMATSLYNSLLREGLHPTEQAFWDKMHKGMMYEQNYLDEARNQAEAEKDDIEAQGGSVSAGFVKQRAAEIIEEKRMNSIPAAAKRADALSEEGVLANQPYGTVGVLFEGISSISRKTKIAERLVPFLRIPSNAMNTFMDYSPYGYKRALLGRGLGTAIMDDTSRVKLKVGAENMSADDKVRHIIKATIGTATMAILANLALGGDEEDRWIDVTYNGFKDSKKNKSLGEDWKPMSFRFKYPDGTWSDRISYMDSPLGAIFASIGRISDSRKYNKGTDEEESVLQLAVEASIAGLLFVKDQNYLKTLTETLGIISEQASGAGVGSKGAQLAASQLRAQLYPSFYRDAFRIYKAAKGESKMYDVPMKDSLMGGLISAMTKEIPLFEGAALKKPAFNTLGYEIKYDIESFPAIPALSAVLDWKNDNESKYPELQYLAKNKLYVKYADVKEAKDAKSFNVKEYTPEDRYNMSLEVAKKMRGFINQSKGTWERYGFTREQKQKAINSALASFTTTAKYNLAKKKGAIK